MSDDKVNLLGVRRDGSSELLGTIPMTAGIKRNELIRDYYGGLIPPKEDSEAELTLIILEEYHNWLVAQGWEAPKLLITP